MTEQRTYWLAEYEGAAPELWTTEAAAIDACDDMARAEGRPWDWITEPDGTRQMIHVNPDNDRPTYAAPGRVTPLVLQTSTDPATSTIGPEGLPASVTKLMDTAPPAAIPWGGMTRDQCAALVAHFWPAIEQHIREQVAQELFAEAEKTTSDDTDPSAKARSAGLYIGAQIARGTDTTRSTR